MHKIYLNTRETFEGKLPSSLANDVADMYAQNKSITDVIHVLRVNGNKISHNVIETVYQHISEIEKTVVNLLNGTSDLYALDETATIPETYSDLFDKVMNIVLLQGEEFTNVYDVSFEELNVQIKHVIDNIISINNTFEDLKLALTQS